MPDSSVSHVLAQYPTAGIYEIQALGSAGGFSGARLWKLRTETGELCLRRWPAEHPTPARLTQIHRVLRHVRDRGCQFVPSPLDDHHGRTFVFWQGNLWELSPWMPGQADFHASPTPARLQAATEALAAWHLAAAEVVWEPGVPNFGPSPGLRARLARLKALQGMLGAQIQQAVQSRRVPELDDLAWRLLQIFPGRAAACGAELQGVVEKPVRLQPCLRDIWHDHVLFTSERITGMVDFGAVRPDHVGTDLARLLGSLVGNQRERWSQALDDYRALAPWDDEDEQLLRAFDHSSVVLSGFSWIEWVYLEERQFADMAAVRIRLQDALSRMQV